MYLPDQVSEDLHFAVFLAREVAVINTSNRTVLTIPDLETSEVSWLWAPEYSCWLCNIGQRCGNSCVISSFSLCKEPPGAGEWLSDRVHCLEVSVCINAYSGVGCSLFLSLHLTFEALPPSEVVLCYTASFQPQNLSFFLNDWICVSRYVRCACDDNSGLGPQVNLLLGMSLKFYEKRSCILTFKIVIIDRLSERVFQSVPRVRLRCSDRT